MEQKFLTRPIITAYSWSVCAGEFGGRRLLINKSAVDKQLHSLQYLYNTHFYIHYVIGANKNKGVSPFRKQPSYGDVTSLPL